MIAAEVEWDFDSNDNKDIANDNAPITAFAVAPLSTTNVSAAQSACIQVSESDSDNSLDAIILHSYWRKVAPPSTTTITTNNEAGTDLVASKNQAVDSKGSK